MTNTPETPSAAQEEMRALQDEVAALRQKLEAAEGESHAAPLVSPLAPKGGFPELPTIDGVAFAALAAGVRYEGRDDVMLASISAGSTIAGVFTQSSTRSAPVLDCQEKLSALEGGDAEGFAIVVNSGNANAFTGRNGQQAVGKTTGAIAKALGISASHVFSASTGVIGEALPAEKIADVADALRDGLASGRAEDAARAIMTTDTFAKGASAQAEIGGNQVSISGFAKGSGMIAPDMATMLVFIFTDAKIGGSALQSMVSGINKTTFNSITVDSDTSTSDTVLVVATGKAGNAEISDPDSADGKVFAAALGEVMQNLAHQVVRDGEGATKFVEVTVSGAASDKDAHQIAMAIANSPLVKTAIAGEDPNWGRVVMATGKSGAEADRDKMAIWFGDVLVAENGWVSPTYREEDGAAYMKQEDIEMRVDVGVGAGSATVWTCDFTHQYITINADYRS